MGVEIWGESICKKLVTTQRLIYCLILIESMRGKCLTFKHFWD